MQNRKSFISFVPVDGLSYELFRVFADSWFPEEHGEIIRT
jgi:hypothetical protein